MRYFLDTEFNGFGGALISLALVPEAEGAPPFYAALDCPEPTEWVAAHVLPVLGIAPVSRETLGRGVAAIWAMIPIRCSSPTGRRTLRTLRRR